MSAPETFFVHGQLRGGHQRWNVVHKESGRVTTACAYVWSETKYVTAFGLDYCPEIFEEKYDIYDTPTVEVGSFWEDVKGGDVNMVSEVEDGGKWIHVKTPTGTYRRDALFFHGEYRPFAAPGGFTIPKRILRQNERGFALGDILQFNTKSGFKVRWVSGFTEAEGLALATVAEQDPNWAVEKLEREGVGRG